LTRVKICCIESADEVALAVASGAHALGLVSKMPSGPGVIPEERIAELARGVPLGAESVLLTTLERPGAILLQHRRCGTSAVQLCAPLEPSARLFLQEGLCGIKLIQVVHVTGPEALDVAREAALYADCLLLDSGRPGAKTKELGGTGRPHDWDVSRKIVEQAELPVYLAGGLTPGNVADAIATVRPFGVDVCSGVRSDGALDPSKLDAFVGAVSTADRS